MKKPHFIEGEDKFSAFASKLGPLVYRGLSKRGVKNIDAAYDNMMRLLAWESNYGLSSVALKQNNYGGYGWNGSTYTTFKNDEDFVNHYLDLMMKRYGAAVNSPDVYTYAKNLKDKGYYEDSYEHYSEGLAGMKSMSRAAAKHRAEHPEMYDMSYSYIAADPAKMGPGARPMTIPKKRVISQSLDPVYSYELPEVVVTGHRPKLTLPDILESQKDAVGKWFSKVSGLNLDDLMWELYAPTYKPLLIPHYDGGEDGNALQNVGTSRKWIANSDSEELSKASNNFLYRLLSFLPYTRLITNAFDIMGLSPDLNGANVADLTDGSGLVAGVLGTKKYQPINNGTLARQIADIKNKSLQKSLIPLRGIDFIGDAYSLYEDYKRLNEAAKKTNGVYNSGITIDPYDYH